MCRFPFPLVAALKLSLKYLTSKLQNPCPQNRFRRIANQGMWCTIYKISFTLLLATSHLIATPVLLCQWRKVVTDLFAITKDFEMLSKLSI